MRSIQTNPGTQLDAVSLNRTLRKVYFLLSLTLLFSGFTAIIAMVTNLTINPILFFVGIFGLLFATQALRNSKWGFVMVFIFTGFMGLTLGPLLNMYLHQYVNGLQLITTALVATGVIFLGLSAYAVITKKNFSYMGGFLVVALLAVIILMLLNMFMRMPALQLGISFAIVVIMSGFILYDTSNIINNRGQTNVIMATVALYLDIFNIFVALLQIFGALGGSRD